MDLSLLFILSDSDTGYAHSIIPYYRKITEVYNLPYLDKPFTKTVLSLIDQPMHNIYGTECCHAFTDLNCSSVDLAKEVDKWCHTWAPLLPEEMAIQNHWEKGP